MTMTMTKKVTTHHIGVVPVSGAGVGHHHVLVVPVVVDDALHARPRVLYVVEVPPQVARLRYGRVIGLHARVDLVHRPAAGVEHRPAGPVQVVAELRVPYVHVDRQGVAAVQLDVVDVPGGERVGVDLQVPQDAGVAGARVVPEVLVDAEFQPFGMYLDVTFDLMRLLWDAFARFGLYRGSLADLYLRDVGFATVRSTCCFVIRENDEGKETTSGEVKGTLEIIDVLCTKKVEF